MKFFVILAALALIASTTVAAASIDTQSYTIEPASVDTKAQIGTFKVVDIVMANKRSSSVDVQLVAEGLAGVARIAEDSVRIPAQTTLRTPVTLLASELGSFEGAIVLSGDISEAIPVQFEVVQDELITSEVLAIKFTPLDTSVNAGSPYKTIIDFQNLLINRPLNVSFEYVLRSTTRNDTDIVLSRDNRSINISYSTLQEVQTGELEEGDYILEVRAEYLDKSSFSSTRFHVGIALLERRLFGIVPFKYLFVLVLVSGLGTGGYKYYQKKQSKKKRYKSILYDKELPKPGPRTVRLGKIAETSKDAYFEIDQLMMHTLIAGSTGGGKTVSAEVIVEEALLQGSSVIVFDPTAQWTGFLRKNTDKKMFAFYPKFGMKQSDARGFNGNVRQLNNPREIIPITKFMKPGEITVFVINKLDPQDIDIIVANTVQKVFHEAFPECKQLKLLIIFDEVHRLLPKFGGSGAGFTQIERGAREFRKWGVGLMLISQVLTDFAGEVKANISTEVQMRTRDQGDLNRIKKKYGDFMLQSLLKAATGTAMIENASYNKGEPYFISMRALLHEHAALPDDVLDQYTKYNAILDDIEYQTEVLEKKKIDVFDMKLELKMAQDKVKQANFNMVDIYLESLKPRIESEFKKLGIAPPVHPVEMLSEEDLQKQIDAARKKQQELSAGGGPLKIFKPLKLNAELSPTSPFELIDNLGILPDADFAKLLSKDTNAFADWADQTDKELGEALRKCKSKDELVKALQEWSKKEDEAEKKAKKEKESNDDQ